MFLLFPSCFSFRFHGLIFLGGVLQDAPGADPYKWSDMGRSNFYPDISEVVGPYL